MIPIEMIVIAGRGRYIAAQIIGAYLASCLVYYQWKPFIHAMEAALLGAGGSARMFTPNGPPGIFALYLLPGQEIGWAFLNEFVNVSAFRSSNGNDRLRHTHPHHGSVSSSP
jgi:glycerol uptake facilitator-like aquaporin